MDQVFEKKNGNLDYEYADKFPSYFIPFTATPQEWQTASQKDVLLWYRIVFFVILAATLYVWVIDPLVHFLKKIFCHMVTGTVGDSQGIPFSSVEKIVAYVPLVKYKTEQYICSYVKDIKEANKPCLIRPTPGDIDDLSGYVPLQHQPHVLSVVKYYGDDTTLDDIMEKGKSADSGDHGTVASDEIKPAVVKSPPRKVSFNNDNSTSAAYLAAQDNTRPKYYTNEDGVLEKIICGLPRELAMKIRNKQVNSNEDNEEATPKKEPVDDTRIEAPAPVSPEKSRRRIKRHRGIESKYAQVSRGASNRVRPMPSGDDQIYHRSYNNSTGSFSGTNPIGGSNSNLKPNRVVLKPLF